MLREVNSLRKHILNYFIISGVPTFCVHIFEGCISYFETGRYISEYQRTEQTLYPEFQGNHNALSRYRCINPECIEEIGRAKLNLSRTARTVGHLIYCNLCRCISMP